jgi:hypothetical protein
VFLRRAQDKTRMEAFLKEPSVFWLFKKEYINDRFEEVLECGKAFTVEVFYTLDKVN